VILYAVYFYVRFAVSYRVLEEIMAERGVDVDHTTLNRWVEKHANIIAKQAHRRKAQPGRSWRMYARSLFLTPNSTTVYVIHCFDLEDGPVVLEAAAGLLGPMDDAYFGNVTDVDLTGPDKGKGGNYVMVDPDYEGDLPEEGYFVIKSPTSSNWLLTRAFVKDGDLAATAQAVKDTMRVYPWADRENGPFLSLSMQQSAHAFQAMPFESELPRCASRRAAPDRRQ
jgi:hypothetical protein